MADVIVEGEVLLELKACKEFDSVHYAQCLNYLRATGLPICLLINFGEPRVKIKRFVNRNGDVEIDHTARLPES
jgi:GxxExxY protein